VVRSSSDTDGGLESATQRIVSRDSLGGAAKLRTRGEVCYRRLPCCPFSLLWYIHRGDVLVACCNRFLDDSLSIGGTQSFYSQVSDGRWLRHISWQSAHLAACRRPPLAMQHPESWLVAPTRLPETVQALGAGVARTCCCCHYCCQLSHRLARCAALATLLITPT